MSIVINVNVSHFVSDTNFVWSLMHFLKLSLLLNRNALSLAMIQSLSSHLNDRPSLRCVVINANGHVFSSGHDLKELVLYYYYAYLIYAYFIISIISTLLLCLRVSSTGFQVWIHCSVCPASNPYVSRIYATS